MTGCLGDDGAWLGDGVWLSGFPEQHASPAMRKLSAAECALCRCTHVPLLADVRLSALCCIALLHAPLACVTPVAERGLCACACTPAGARAAHAVPAG